MSKFTDAKLSRKSRLVMTALTALMVGASIAKPRGADAVIPLAVVGVGLAAVGTGTGVYTAFIKKTPTPKQNVTVVLGNKKLQRQFGGRKKLHHMRCVSKLLPLKVLGKLKKMGLDPRDVKACFR